MSEGESGENLEDEEDPNPSTLCMPKSEGRMPTRTEGSNGLEKRKLLLTPVRS